VGGLVPDEYARAPFRLRSKVGPQGKFYRARKER